MNSGMTEQRKIIKLGPFYSEFFAVIPAKAGIQVFGARLENSVIPAQAGIHSAFAGPWPYGFPPARE
jgi:hypothetical protein